LVTIRSPYCSNSVVSKQLTETAHPANMLLRYNLGIHSTSTVPPSRSFLENGTRTLRNSSESESVSAFLKFRLPAGFSLLVTSSLTCLKQKDGLEKAPHDQLDFLQKAGQVKHEGKNGAPSVDGGTACKRNFKLRKRTESLATA
jgi:hypothetical protein